jgi:hypothetical protein
MFWVLSVSIIRCTMTATGATCVTLGCERCGKVCLNRLSQRSLPNVTYVVPVAVNCSYSTPDDGYGKYPKHVEQRFPNFFQVGTTFISQNVLRTTLLLSSLKANCLRFSTIVCDMQFTLILFFLSFLE